MTHEALHQKALTLAQEYRTKEGEILDVLSRMQEQSSFYSLGYKGLFEYCQEALKLTEAQAFYFSRVARRSVEVPELKKAVENGTLTLSKARRIEPVITQETSEMWIEKAVQLPQKELEKEVRKANPNARPENEKPYEKTLRRLMDILGKSREQVLEQAIELLADRVDPERKADRAIVSSRKQKPPTYRPGRHAIAAGVKHAVVLEQGYRCAVCKSRRYLQFHHIKPVSEGGLGTPDNLTLLCSACHAIHHRRQRETALARSR